MATLANITKGKRKALGLTQLELADLANCGTTFIYDLENGEHNLRLDKLIAVLGVLGCAVSIDGELVDF